MSDLSKIIRKAFKESDDIRDAGLETPSDVERFDDILYGQDSKWQVLDVYRPKNKKGKIPVIISVHGGGWVYGDKERYQYYCMDLAQRGFAVVNFTYRLAPEFKFPAQLEDITLVTTWISANKEKYGFSDDVFALGDSAGAHLLGLYMGISFNSEYADKFSFKATKDLQIKGIALNCGAYKLDPNRDEVLKELLPEKGSDNEIELINVLNYITEDFPPTFVTTATGDFLKNQAPMLVDVLVNKKVPCVFKQYGDKENELQHVFHLNIRTNDAKICNDDECEFFGKLVHKG